MASLAFVAALSLAYGVLRPSLRAAVAFAAGALSLVGAAIAIADARWNGFAAHQLPAFALAAGGTALLAAAVLALRSKPRVSGARRAVRWGLTFIATVLVGYYAVVPIGAALWLTGKPRVAVRTLAVPHENVALRTADGVRLAAWYVPSRNGAAIVLVHGGGGDRDGLKLHATMLARHGYGVLLYDERGRGDSGGRSNGFGWDWPADVRASVDFLERRGIRQIGVLGLSTGAEVAITAAAEDPRVAAVVADGAEARTLDDFAHLHGADRVTSLPVLGGGDCCRPRHPPHDASAARSTRSSRGSRRARCFSFRATTRRRSRSLRCGRAWTDARACSGTSTRRTRRDSPFTRARTRNGSSDCSTVRSSRRTAPERGRRPAQTSECAQRSTVLQTRKGALMARNTRWTGWIGFAGWLMIIIGGLDFFEGLIAIIRGEYYAVTPNQIIVFDTTTWGWITLLWGIIVLSPASACSPRGLGAPGSRSSSAAQLLRAARVLGAARSTRSGP